MYYSRWIELPLSTRNTLADVFKIIKTGSTHVVDNKVASDGYPVKDVDAALTIESMQDYAGTKETDSMILWELIVAKAEGKELPEDTGTVSMTGATALSKPIETSPAKKKRGRPPGKKK